jgi:hypothetical protein
MVVDDRFVMSPEETEEIQGKALLAHRKAKQGLNLLLTEAERISQKLRHVASLIDELKTSEDFLHGPAITILQLPDTEFGEKQSLKTTKAFAQAVVVALKQVHDARQRLRDLGMAE